MVIVRKAWTRHVETYRLELTEEYVRLFNQYLKDRCTGEVIPVTAEEIAACVSGDAGSLLLDVEYEWKTWGEPFKMTLRDMVYDLINEDIWDCDYNDEYYDTDDWETFVEQPQPVFED